MPPQIGFFMHQYAMLRVLEFYYDFLDKSVKNKTWNSVKWTRIAFMWLWVYQPYTRWRNQIMVKRFYAVKDSFRERLVWDIRPFSLGQKVLIAPKIAVIAVISNCIINENPSVQIRIRGSSYYFSLLQKLSLLCDT